MSNAVVEMKPGALAQVQSAGRMAVAEIISHVAAVQEVMRAVMKPDVHYGKIPGTPKPTLYKPGAELLGMTFHIAPSFQAEDLSTADTVRYRVTCVGTHQTSGVVMGEGKGEASSGEEKYKWRKAVCDEEFDETPLHLRRSKFGKQSGGGFYKQKQVRTEPADLANTVLKMAVKRAQIAMILNALAASDMFAQDLEDLNAELREQLVRQNEAGEQAQPEPQVWPDEVFAKQLPKFKKALADGKTVDEILAWAETKGQLTDAQKAEIRDAAPKGNDAPTFAGIADKLNKAKDADALALAGDLIKSIPDEAQRGELQAIYDRREAELKN